MTLVSDLDDAARDLLLGSRCVGCARPGRLLCRDCAEALPHAPAPAWPSPVPGGLVEPWAAAPYDATVRAMVIGLKERGLTGLVRPLAGLLAGAVAAELPALSRGSPVVLVPVPSRAASVRQRGHDPTAAVTARAARLLGLRSVGLLRLRRGVVDQAGLDATARAANLHGSMHCPAARLRRLARVAPVARVVVCDDVLTTGATAREAQRALEAVGLEVVRIATVAATVRRRPALGRVG